MLLLKTQLFSKQRDGRRTCPCLLGCCGWFTLQTPLQESAGLAWCHLTVTGQVGISVFPWSKRKFNQVQLHLHMSTYHKIFRAYQIAKIRLRFSWSLATGLFSFLFFSFSGAGGGKRMSNLFLGPLAYEMALGWKAKEWVGMEMMETKNLNKGKLQPIQQHGRIERAVSLKAAPAQRLLLVLMLQCSGYSRWNHRGNSRSNDALHHPWRVHILLLFWYAQLSYSLFQRQANLMLGTKREI